MLISNKALFLLIVFSISLSIITTIYMLEKMGNASQKTVGKATTDSGKITVSVQNSVSIVLINDMIDFGTGYVNTSKCQTNATLYAGETYNDSDGVDCWTDNTVLPTSLILENDGNRNVTITVRGPANSSFFNNYNGSEPYGISWKARNRDYNSCPGIMQANYTDFNGTAKAACGDMYPQDQNDTIAIDLKVVIPAHNLTQGVYQNISISFTAAAS